MNGLKWLKAEGTVEGAFCIVHNIFWLQNIYEISLTSNAKVSCINMSCQRNRNQYSYLNSHTTQCCLCSSLCSRCALSCCRRLSSAGARADPLPDAADPQNPESFDPAQLSELCTSAFSSTDSTVLQCEPDSALTVDKRNTKPFFTGWIYVLS